MMVFEMTVLWILCIGLCMSTVSNALLISSDTSTVLRDGVWLNPCAIVLLIWCKAVVVECLVLKPCWCSVDGMFVVMSGSITFFRVFAIGDRSEIGL